MRSRVLMRIRFLPLVLALASPGFAALTSINSPDPEPLEGTWSGTVSAPQGEAAPIAFEFRRTASGALGFHLHFPTMFTHHADLGVTVEPAGPGQYIINSPFPIRLQLDGGRLTGDFTAAGLPLDLRRDAPVPARIEAPEPPPAPAPLWKYSLGAGTWAPPVADGGIVYLGAGDGRFHAVQGKDGTALWVWPGTTPIDGRAALDDVAAYFLDTRANLVALDRKTGGFRWRLALHNEFLAGSSVPDNPTFNHRAASPLVHEGVLYIGSSDGGLYAIDPQAGAILWRHDARAPIYSGVALHGPDTLMFGTMDGSVVLLDRRTRRETIRVQTGGAVVTTPVIAHGRLIAGSRDYLLHAFDATRGTPAWKFSYWFSWIESTPSVHDGLLYLGGSDFARVSAIDPVSGRARWSTIVHGLSWGTPLVTERHVFAGTVNQNMPGTLIEHHAGLVKLDRDTGAVQWRLTLPAAAQGRFAGYAGGPVLADNKVIVAGLDGFLTAYPVE